MLVLPSIVIVLYSVIIFGIQILYLLITGYSYAIDFPQGILFDLLFFAFPPTIQDLGFKITLTSITLDYSVFSMVIFLIFDSLVAPILIALIVNEGRRAHIYNVVETLKLRFVEFFKFNILVLFLNVIMFSLSLVALSFPDYSSIAVTLLALYFLVIMLFGFLVTFVPFLLLEGKPFLESIVLSYKYLTSDLKKMLEILIVNFGIFSVTKTFLGILGGGDLFLTLALGFVIGSASITVYYLYLTEQFYYFKIRVKQ